MQRVTLKDLAKEVGLSVNTVSRALRDMPDIHPKTKDRVKEAAKNLGYLPNLAASMLRTNRSKTIGVIVSDIANPVFAGYVKGIEHTARENGYSIILANTNENYPEEINALKTMIVRGVDGFLLVPSMKDSESVMSLESNNIPYVLLGRHFSNLNSNVVSNDDIFGGFLAGHHLISRGHREFAYVTGPLFISAASERFEGFKKAIKQQGLPISSIKVYETKVSMEGAYDVACSLIKNNELPTAIFCFSDFMALGILNALLKHNISVPDRIAVMGYDDIDFSDIVVPGLTTIDISKYRLGRRATDLLIKEINTPIEERTKKHLILEPKLIVRDST